MSKRIEVQDGQFILAAEFGIIVQGIDDGDPTAGDSQEVAVSLRNTNNVRAGYLGFDGDTVLQIINDVDFGVVEIVGLDNGSPVTMIEATPDDDVRLSYAGNDVLRTNPASSGGVEINNTLTGVGYERVLTLTDQNLIVGTGVANPSTSPPYDYDADLRFLNANSIITAEIGWNTLVADEFGIIVAANSATFALRGFDAASNGKISLDADFDGSTRLYDSANNPSVVVAETRPLASGGFFINNTLTGGGFERALTTADVPTGTPINGTVTDSTLRWSGTNWVEETQIRISAAGALSILDGTLADSATFSHDGANFNTTFVNTTDWNLTGLTSLQAGTVDADFDAITATSYGGITEANLVDKTAVETISGIWTHSDLLITDASDATSAGLRLPHGTAPTTPVDGDLWTTTASVFARVNGATLDLANTAAATLITVADTADTTTNVVLVGNPTGDEAPLTDAALTYNAGTGTLSATSFAGSGSALTALNASNISTGTLAVARGGTGATATTGTGNNVLSASPTFTGTVSMAALTATGALTLNGVLTTDNSTSTEVGFKGAPINTQNGNYTLVLADCGRTIYKASGGAGETITIPSNGTVAFPVGTVISIINNGGGNLSIAITTNTLILANDGSTGTRTLADHGVATITKVATTTWFIAGAGVT